MMLDEGVLSFKPGEIVIVEYTSRSQAPLLFAKILETFGDEILLVLDIVDIGFTFKKTLEIAGVGPADLDDVPVVKIGGKITWGRMLAHFDVYTDPRIFIEKTENLVKKEFTSKRGGIIAFGTERVPIIHKDARRVSLCLMNCASEKLGNPDKTLVYFINRDTSERAFLGLMEDIATRVILASEDGVRVIKSLQE